MRYGCLTAALFALAGLIIFPFLAPILFHGKDMESVGQAAAIPIVLVCGLAGLAFGLFRARAKPATKAAGQPSQAPARTDVPGTPGEGLEADLRWAEDNLVLASEKSVFLSYSRADRAMADRLALGLTQYGLAVWVDRIEIGDDNTNEEEIRHRLADGIEKTDCFIVLLSTHAIKRPWVQWEYEEALRQRKGGKSLLLLHAITDDCAVPAGLSQTGRIDLRPGFDSGVLDVVSHFGITVRKKRDEEFVSSKPHDKHLSKTADPASGLAYNQGLLHYHRGDSATAIEKWEAAARLDPGNVDALYNSAVALYEFAFGSKGRPEFDSLVRRTIDRYEQILAVRNDDVDAMVNLAAAYRESGTHRDRSREMALLLDAYRRAPDYGLVWLNMGHFYARNGGVDDIARLMAGDAEDGTATIDIAQLDQARQCYLKAAEVDPALTDAPGMAEFMDQLIALAREQATRGERPGADD